jgi:phosphatidylserine/phosphatidylglycerophosphate/cardiolipin synthase-like enzyme
MAIIGSANASVTSVDRKAEAVIVLDNPKAVADIRSAIAGWKVGVAPLTPQWLARVEKLPRTRRSPTTTFLPGTDQRITDPNKPLWLIDFVWGQLEVGRRRH